MKRRVFCWDMVKGAAALAAYAKIAASPFNLLAAENSAQEDFTVLEKDKDFGSLEGLLAGGKEDIPEIECASFKVNFPSILYLFQMDESKRRGYCDSGMGYGLAMILNKEGYFLTVYHGVKYFLKDKDHNMLLLREPSSEIIRRPKILSYSEKWDLALGKIDVPEGFDTPPVYITKGDPKPGAFTVAVQHTMETINLKGIDNRVFNSDVVDSGNCSFNDYPITEEDLNLKKGPSERIILIDINIVAQAVNKDGAPIQPEGEFLTDSEIKGGDSGTPLFSAHNDLAGIMKAGPKRTKKQDSYYTICVSPDKIRGLMDNYISACRD